MPHFYGAVGAPIPGRHQWQPHSRRPLVTGSGRGSREARLLLQRLRKGHSSPEYGLRATATVLTMLVHALVVFLIMVHHPGHAPPADLPEQMASTEVRLIDKPAPPPPPPPIKLPERPRGKTAPSVDVKEAPEAAMPPIPQVGPSTPEIRLSGATPELNPVLEAPAPTPPAAANPPTDEAMPDVDIAQSLPRVVLETSDMALPTPTLQGDRPPEPVEAPAVQPVPAPRTETRVEIGQPDLEVSGAIDVKRPSRKTVTAEVATPEVPAVRLAGPEVTATPEQAPDIAVEPSRAPTVHVPSAAMAPIPEAPSETSTPALDLPVADVAEPQAPHVQAPSLRVETSAAKAEAPASAATVTQTADETQNRRETGETQSVSGAEKQTAQTSSAQGSDSWLPASDQFEPSSGESTGAGSGRNAAGAEDNGKGYVQLEPRGNSDVMRRSSDRLGYKPTIFDQYWAPENESVLDTFLRHFVEKLTVKHTFHVAPGVRIHCVMGPLAIFIGCGGDPPRAASGKSGDDRLDMAPANPLVPGLGSSAPATSRSAPDVQVDNDVKCAMARVAGGPPPPGCAKAPVKPSQSDRWDGG